ISSQPSLGELLNIMKKNLEEGHDVIGVFISSEFSGTYNSAKLLSLELQEAYPNQKIAIIDSESNSMQLGFMALIGARLTEQGENFETIVETMEETIKRSRFLFIPENLTYLEKGGRIGKAGSLLGNVLKITPILTVKDKKTEIYKTVRTKKRAIDTMIDKMLEDHALANVQEIAIHHINCEEEALELKEKVKALIDVDVVISSIGPVIGLHVGPGAIGIVYTTKKDIR
ncbi:MAG TPA: DegV family protein, partial [Erysipelothrix sp.]|nr:DegV family protein [Erysipelothrix sp.]